MRFDRLPIWKRFTQGTYRRPDTVPLDRLEPLLPRPALLEHFFAPNQADEPVLADFKIEKLLGSGGMGVVQRVRSSITGKPYALKTIHTHRLELQRPFMEELQTWIDLPPHPNLVACYFFRTLGDRLGIFAEYVQGEPLSQWIANHADVTVAQILDMAMQSAQALQAVHDRQCVHQDVKPANLLMRSDGCIKLTDFGLARARQKARVVENEDTPTSANPLVSRNGMTLAYSSPEQRAGEPLTLHTDMFSWAVSVLEMAVGGVQWLVGEAAIHALEEYLDEPETFPGRPILPPDLVEILTKCLARNPSKRYASMHEVLEALQTMTPFREHAPPMRAISSPGPIVAKNATERFSYGLAVPILLDTLNELKMTNALTPSVEETLEKRMAQSGLRGRSTPRAEAITELIGMSICLEHYPPNGVFPWKRLDLLFITGLFHEYMDDPMGALALYREALETSIRAVIEGEYVIANYVAEACARVGTVLAVMQMDGDASGWIRDAARIRRHLVMAPKLEEYAEDLGDAMLLLATMSNDIGVKRSRLTLVEFEQALEAYMTAWVRLDDPAAQEAMCPQQYSRILVKSVAQLDAAGDARAPDHIHHMGQAWENFSDVTMARRRLRLKRAVALAGKARTLAIAERLDDAETNCQEALSLCAEVSFLPWDTQRMAAMAEALLAHAFVLRAREQAEAAAYACQRAIDVLSVPALATDLHASPGLLVQAYLDLSAAKQHSGDVASAFLATSRAVEIAERLVLFEGRQRFAVKLASAYAAQAVAACNAGYPEQTLGLAEKVHVMVEQVVRMQDSQRQPPNLQTWANIVEPLVEAQRRARALIGLPTKPSGDGASHSEDERLDAEEESRAQSIPLLPTDGNIEGALAQFKRLALETDLHWDSSPPDNDNGKKKV